MANIQCRRGRVAALRTQQNMTQEKLGAMSRVNPRTIQRAERGEPLQFDTVASIAAALKVTVADLTDSGEETPGQFRPEEGNSEPESNAVVLRQIASGKALLDMLHASFSGRVDCEVEPTEENIGALTSIIEEIERLLPDPWESPHAEHGRPKNLVERLRKALDLSSKLVGLEPIGVAVFAGTYTARAQIPTYYEDEAMMLVRRSAPYEAVTICRVMVAMRTTDRMTVRVNDKWEAMQPDQTKAELDDDIPF